MTAEQLLVGAMGWASWRSHYQLREYASLAPRAGIVRGGKSLQFARPGVLGLNEVGVTDQLLAAIWRFGPAAAAYAISSHAEARNLGADIAIVHQSKSQILLYQAKLAQQDGSVFRLKSPVTRSQLSLLRQPRKIKIQEDLYRVTSRLALYQQDLTSYLTHCTVPPGPRTLRKAWPGGTGPHPAGDGTWDPMPEASRKYYQAVLARCGCSPGGVLAALVPDGSDQVTSVPVSSTWPWEFDTHHWLRKRIEGDNRKQLDSDKSFGGPPPRFTRYPKEADDQELGSQVGPDEQVLGIAEELAAGLRLPAGVRLHVIALP